MTLGNIEIYFLMIIIPSARENYLKEVSIMNEEKRINVTADNDQYHINDENAKFGVDENEKHEIKIRIDKPADFDATMEIQITTSDELSRIINNMMSQVFADYHGCSITCSLTPGLGMVATPRFYFKVLPDQVYDDPNNIFAFVPIGKANTNQNKNSLYARIQHVSNTVATPMSRKMELTDDGKSALVDLMMNGDHGKKFDQWNTCYQITPSNRDTFIGLAKLDITKILRKVFGEVDAEGTPLYYSVTPSYNVGGGNGMPENWLITIQRLHHGAEARAAALAGLTLPDDYGVPPMVTVNRAGTTAAKRY